MILQNPKIVSKGKENNKAKLIILHLSLKLINLKMNRVFKKNACKFKMTVQKILESHYILFAHKKKTWRLTYNIKAMKQLNMSIWVSI